MKLLHTKYFKNFILTVLTISIFNTVIDPPDIMRNMDHDVELEEDTSLNEMESIVEVVVEKCLDIDNAIPEKEEEDSGEFCKKIQIFYFHKPYISYIQKTFVPIPTYKSFYFDNFSAISILIDSPPPKV